MRSFYKNTKIRIRIFVRIRILYNLLFRAAGFSRFFCGNSGFFVCRGCQFFLKAVYLTLGIQKTLLTSIKRVTVATNFSLHFLLCRTSGKLVATGAGDTGIVVELWVN